MKLLRLLAPACLFVSAQVFAGGSLDLSVNNSTAALEYDATRMGSPLHISTGVLHHETDGDLVSFGLNAVDVRSQNSPIRIGVGGKVFGYFTDEADSGALAIGGFIRYTPPELAGLGFAGHAYYAPSVLSFNSTDKLVDLGARVEYKLLPTAVVYLGYRFFEATDEDQEIEIANAGHFGLRINF
ncbi:MAG: YfaZ family outer membrane protein [Bermanella sp.]